MGGVFLPERRLEVARGGLLVFWFDFAPWKLNARRVQRVPLLFACFSPMETERLKGFASPQCVGVQ